MKKIISSVYEQLKSLSHKFLYFINYLRYSYSNCLIFFLLYLVKFSQSSVKRGSMTWIKICEIFLDYFKDFLYYFIARNTHCTEKKKYIWVYTICYIKISYNWILADIDGNICYIIANIKTGKLSNQNKIKGIHFAIKIFSHIAHLLLNLQKMYR